MDAIGDLERGIGLPVEEAFTLDGELPICGLRMQRAGGADRPLALVVNALGSFHVQLALTGQAEGSILGIRDQLPSVRLALRPGAFQHRLQLGFMGRVEILGELESLPTHNGLRLPGPENQRQAEHQQYRKQTAGPITQVPTGPECARPRAQQHPQVVEPRNLPACRTGRDLLRSRTSTLRQCSQAAPQAPSPLHEWDTERPLSSPVHWVKLCTPLRRAPICSAPSESTPQPRAPPRARRRPG